MAYVRYLTVLPLYACVIMANLVAGFSTSRQSNIIQPVRVQQYHAQRKIQSFTPTPLFAGGFDDDDDVDSESVQTQDNFDGKGFAGYLAPYALALVGSVAVTAAFVKFVLLDY